MTDNLSPRAVETNSPYSYGSAPVASFQLIQRADPKAELAGYIQYHADGLARALVDGRAHDVAHYADHLVKCVMMALGGE
jgi:hypothetical protein